MGEILLKTASLHQNPALASEILIRHAIDAVISIDQESRIILWNPAAQIMFGYSPEEVLGKSMPELIMPPEYRKRHYEGVSRVLAGGSGSWLNRTVEVSAKRRNGTIFPVELSIFSSGTEEKPEFTAFIRDITARKKLEEDVQQKSEGLKSMASQLSQSLNREHLVSDFAESIYHKINPECILKQAVKDIGVLVQADHCAIWEYNAHLQEFLPLKYEYRRDEEKVPSCLGSMMADIPKESSGLNRFEMIIIRDASKFGSALEIDRQIIRENQPESLLQIPIEYLGKEYGLLRIFLLPQEELDWDEEMTLSVQTIAKQIAVGIRQACYISDLQRSIEQLKESEERFKSLAESAPVMVWISDRDRMTTYVNQAWAKFLNQKRENLLDLHWKAIVHPDDLPLVEQAYVKAFQERTEWRAEARVNVGNGVYKWVIAIGTPKYTPQGEFDGFAGICVDIDERKKMEMNLRLGKEEAEIASTNKSLFLTTVSHELKTPLNAIIGFSEMLEGGYAGALNDKQQRYAHNIATSGHHLLDLVNNILDISRIETGRIQLVRQWISVNALLEQLKRMMQDQITKKGIIFSFSVQPEADYLEADPIRLQEILLNLLNNAIKFNREGGSILVRVYGSEDKQWVVFEVEDTGIGIAADKMERLFTPFYQADAGYNRHQEGTGLGLALVKHLVEAHGGDISVASQKGIGSRFTFKIPAKVPC